MGKIFSFTGPAGTGKTTIAYRIMQLNPAIEFVTGWTTRAPRPSDLPTEYHYVSEREFLATREKDLFLWDIEVHGKRYGTPKASIERAKERSAPSVIILVPESAVFLKQHYPEVVESLFIVPPSEPILRQRLVGRETSETAIEQRLLECASWYADAQRAPIRYTFVTNDGTIDEAIAQIPIDLT